MKRDLKHVKHLLELIQAHDDVDGIYYVDLELNWQQSGGNAAVPLKASECNYLVNRCADAGFITISGGLDRVQLTWSGHDYLDSVTLAP